jgi:hypothetical protein
MVLTHHLGLEDTLACLRPPDRLAAASPFTGGALKICFTTRLELTVPTNKRPSFLRLAGCCLRVQCRHHLAFFGEMLPQLAADASAYRRPILSKTYPIKGHIRYRSPVSPQGSCAGRHEADRPWPSKMSKARRGIAPIVALNIAIAIHPYALRRLANPDKARRPAPLVFCPCWNSLWPAAK